MYFQFGKLFDRYAPQNRQKHAHIAQNNFLLFSKVNMLYAEGCETKKAAVEETSGIAVEKDTVAIISFSFVCFTLRILPLIDDS